VGWAIIDTSVYVGHWEGGAFDEALEAVRRAYVVRHSAVVLSELRRGARTPAAQRLVATLHRAAPVVWAPTAEDWWKAGHLVRAIGDPRHWDVAKRREFQNDALIALTGRHHGATVVTANREDFALLAKVTGVRILAV
jgi:predicted nucleic acid-binding protein